MCGIAGWIDWQVDLTERSDDVQKMGATLACRGPDADAVWLTQRAALAHRRLIVIDPAGGTQPMQRGEFGQRYVIVYNGELYNMEEVRDALVAQGHRLTSRSDTELILRAYMEWGPNCVDRFNGIFAFGIWSEREQSLFLARDRMGVKPLFYTTQPERLLFASELKAILANPYVEAEVDLEGLAELFFIGPARTPGHAVFKGIRELRPGHWILYTKNDVKETCYWKLEAIAHTDDLRTTINTVHDLLDDAVSRQLVSDVPIATLLSGGLDSSAVSALAARALRSRGQGPLHTYSVDFVDAGKYFEANAFQTSRDAPWVKRVAEYLGTVHHDIVFDNPEMLRHLLRPLQARDLPGMADIDVSLFLFCEAIKQGATVALSGEAADEVFGGYPWFHREDTLQAHTFPWSMQLQRRVPIVHPELRAAIRPEAYVAGRYEEALSAVPRLPGESAEDARIRQISHLSITRFLATLLERKDRMSMAASLEVRVPFCDHRLVQYVWNVPWALRNTGGVAKGVLRNAVIDVLPDDVVWRKKTPYPSTHDPAYLAAVRQWLYEILEDASSPILALIDVDAVLAELAASRTPGEHKPWFGQIMGVPQLFDYLIQINAWLRRFNVRVTGR